MMPLAFDVVINIEAVDVLADVQVGVKVSVIVDTVDIFVASPREQFETALVGKERDDEFFK